MGTVTITPPKISFSPPDITDEEIEAVTETLRSGWITTGPKTKEFEGALAEYCDTERVVCLNSATACMELALRIYGVGPGDEVITTAYTYTASASVILHLGATPVLVDTAPDSFHMDLKAAEMAITEKTKAIIPVDIAGLPCDMDEIQLLAERQKDKFRPAKGTVQKELGRILILSDAAHSIGALYKGKPLGSQADFTVFSLHAVKNLTTGEGGAVSFNSLGSLSSDILYNEFMLLSLHGQNKDALTKTQIGSWKYDIVVPGWKCNMTDISAALGLVQLKRYRKSLLKRREEIFTLYNTLLQEDDRFILPEFQTEKAKGSCHLYMIRIKNSTEEERDLFIKDVGEKGVPLNVHYIPLPLHSCYQNLGYREEDYPEACAMYRSEITLPLHTRLTDEEICYITDVVKETTIQKKK